MRKLILLVCVVLLVVIPAAAQEDTFPLTILHTNDTHSWHEPNSSGDGGAARLASVVSQIRESRDNVLFVDGGDRFTGTLFHVQWRGQDQVQVMNALGYDAMTLGNHEFDDGEDVLLNFVSQLEFPAVSANITDWGSFAQLDELINAFAVVDVNGQQIGVIGLITPETPELTKASDEIVFSEDLVAVTQAAVDELTAQGVNKIILITHIGLELDRAVAAGVTGVDVIVGGHSHTLLGNLYEPALEGYPVIVENPEGNPVYIVQAGSNSTYLGRLDVTFDAEGVATAVTGDVILLSRYITPDPAVAEIVAELAGPVEELRQQPTGAEAVAALNGDRRVCRVEECNLGSLIADAMRAESGAQIAITNGGGIRASIDTGEVTVGEVVTVLPFGNLLSTFELTGADVTAALENGVSRVTVDAGNVVRDGASGRFPQVSGLRFSFDPNLEAGSRIVSVEVMNEAGEYVAIDPAATYTVASNDFMRGAGDGYNVFRDNAINAYDYGKPLDQVLREYMVTNTPINAEVQGRITIVNATLPPA